MWELDYKESWVLKNWCFWTVVLEKTLESSLDCKEIQPVHSKGDQSWVFIEITDVEAETPILWPPDVKSWLIWNAPDAGRDWGQEEKGTTEDEMVGWHHWLHGRVFGWTLVAGDGQGDLACWGSWGCKEPDMTERLNCTELNPLQYPAWVNPCTEESGGLQSMVSKSWTRLRYTHLSCMTSVFICVFLVLNHSTNCFHYFWLLSLSHILSCWLLCSFPFVFYLPIFKVYSMVIKRGWYT